MCTRHVFRRSSHRGPQQEQLESSRIKRRTPEACAATLREHEGRIPPLRRERGRRATTPRLPYLPLKLFSKETLVALCYNSPVIKADMMVSNTVLEPFPYVQYTYVILPLYPNPPSEQSPVPVIPFVTHHIPLIPDHHGHPRRRTAPRPAFSCSSSPNDRRRHQRKHIDTSRPADVVQYILAHIGALTDVFTTENPCSAIS